MSPMDGEDATAILGATQSDTTIGDGQTIFNTNSMSIEVEEPMMFSTILAAFIVTEYSVGSPVGLSLASMEDVANHIHSA